MLTVRPASLCDLPYVDALQRKNADALAFYPRAAFERECAAGRIVLAEWDGEPCGYLYHGAFSVDLKIHQACIQYDLRGKLYGSALVRFLVDLAEPLHVASITLRCGSDIEANAFWRAMGFECERVSEGGIRRRRDLNHWVRRLQPDLFGAVAVEPSKREQDARAWAARSVQLGNQFIRGRALRQYRRAILTLSANDLTKEQAAALVAPGLVTEP